MPEELKLPEKERKKVVKRVEQRRDELKGLLTDLRSEIDSINKARKVVKAEEKSFLTSKKKDKFLEEIKIPEMKIMKEKR